MLENRKLRSGIGRYVIKRDETCTDSDLTRERCAYYVRSRASRLSLPALP